MMDLQSSLILSPTSEQEFSWGGVDTQSTHGRFCPTPSSDESQSSFLEGIDNTAKDEKKKTSTYKHVPHREKPPHLVARRNARERRRVQAVNGVFAKLRKCVPIENRSKRLSKVKTLHKAIEYIAALQRLLEEDDAATSDKMNNNNIINSSTSSNNANANNANNNNNNSRIDMGGLTLHAANPQASSLPPTANISATSVSANFEQIGEVSSTSSSTFRPDQLRTPQETATEISPGWCSTSTTLDDYTANSIATQEYAYAPPYQYQGVAGAFQHPDLQYQCSPLAAYVTYQTATSRLSPNSC
ncbi:hypothetical protein BIW11_00329 [Tropilaelaps mercedesae]|uniref:BHLH domain-containing protein n=1 Tax=Tropilaelaps mercedesae TaxID=418985 RepID=A0A1V9XXY5_9ACAR|nr:hypothetical protein BIW11_00329 [Tropilaelaps mercedesae]